MTGTSTYITPWRFSQPASRLDGTVPIFQLQRPDRQMTSSNVSRWHMTPAEHIWFQNAYPFTTSHCFKPNFSLDLWSDWSGSLFKICTMPMFRRKWGPATCSLLLSQHPSLPCQSQWHHNVIIPYRKDSLCGSFKTVNYSLWKTQAAWIHAHKRFSDAHYLGLFSP